jgi:hypothetical protein
MKGHGDENGARLRHLHQRTAQVILQAGVGSRFLSAPVSLTGGKIELLSLLMFFRSWCASTGRSSTELTFCRAFIHAAFHKPLRTFSHPPDAGGRHAEKKLPHCGSSLKTSPSPIRAKSPAKRSSGICPSPFPRRDHRAGGPVGRGKEHRFKADRAVLGRKPGE